jgi:hypothetical protein
LLLFRAFFCWLGRRALFEAPDVCVCVCVSVWEQTTVYICMSGTITVCMLVCVRCRRCTHEYFNIHTHMRHVVMHAQACIIGR